MPAWFGIPPFTVKPARSSAAVAGDDPGVFERVPIADEDRAAAGAGGRTEGDPAIAVKSNVARGQQRAVVQDDVAGRDTAGVGSKVNVVVHRKRAVAGDGGASAVRVGTAELQRAPAGHGQAVAAAAVVGDDSLVGERLRGDGDRVAGLGLWAQRDAAIGIDSEIAGGSSVPPFDLMLPGTVGILSRLASLITDTVPPNWMTVPPLYLLLPESVSVSRAVLHELERATLAILNVSAECP